MNCTVSVSFSSSSLTIKEVQDNKVSMLSMEGMPAFGWINPIPDIWISSHLNTLQPNVIRAMKPEIVPKANANDEYRVSIL